MAPQREAGHGCPAAVEAFGQAAKLARITDGAAERQRLELTACGCVLEQIDGRLKGCVHAETVVSLRVPRSVRSSSRSCTSEGHATPNPPSCRGSPPHPKRAKPPKCRAKPPKCRTKSPKCRKFVRTGLGLSFRLPPCQTQPRSPLGTGGLCYRFAMTTKTERLNVRVSEVFANKLAQLADAQGETQSDVIRRAVALYSFAKEEENRGRKLGFYVEENGRDVVKQIVVV